MWIWTHPTHFSLLLFTTRNTHFKQQNSTNGDVIYPICFGLSFCKKFLSGRVVISFTLKIPLFLRAYKLQIWVLHDDILTLYGDRAAAPGGKTIISFLLPLYSDFCRCSGSADATQLHIYEVGLGD